MSWLTPEWRSTHTPEDTPAARLIAKAYLDRARRNPPLGTVSRCDSSAFYDAAKACGTTPEHVKGCVNMYDFGWRS